MAEHLVIVGAGQAAAQAIHTLRQNRFEGSITLVGEEPYAPYQRPPLSKKYLAGELPRERLSLRPLDYYRDKQAELELATRAEEIEPAQQRVRLADGRQLQYDRLILATGSRVRRIDVPGAELMGVHYLRTIDDVDAFAPLLQPGARLVLVGAGYIGLEVAAVAAARGLDVTVLEAGDRVMNRVVSPEVSSFYHRRHSEAGVKLHYGTTVSGFKGAEKVVAVETADGESYPCDLAIVGIGVEPNTELAWAAGLACDNGITVDEYGRTEDARIVAAGDCTCHPHPLFGRQIRLESVQNAIEQAKAAAANFAGEPHAYTEVPWFWSDQYELKLQIAGLSSGHEEIAVRGDFSTPGGFAIYYLREGKPIAVEAVNSPRDFMFGRKLIAAGLQVSAQELADPGTDLAKLAARSA